MESGPGSGRDRIPKSIPRTDAGEPHQPRASARQEKMMATKTRQTTKPRRRTKSAAANRASNEQYRFIAEAAYYKAEKRDFVPGFEELDWLEAEQEIASSPTNY